jgi:hypothetical protein
MATTQSNHYQVLMLDPEVDGDILATVYRRLVQRHLLALAEGGSTVGDLQAIEQAYAVLRDPYRRARYDAELAGRGPHSSAPVAQTAVAVVPVMARRAPAPVMTGQALSVTVRSTRTRPAGQVSVLDFGRYAGWSLRQLAAHDPDYLEWLLRAPGGRQYHAEIMAILQPR